MLQQPNEVETICLIFKMRKLRKRETENLMIQHSIEVEIWDLGLSSNPDSVSETFS